MLRKDAFLFVRESHTTVIGREEEKKPAMRDD
jgi:hypothetical protein